MPLHLPKVRGDLEYFDQEVEGETVVVVRDPIRGTYFRYNPLQAAMLRSLDGVRSLDEMVAALSREFDVEIPRIAAERFIAHARKQMLLDVASYQVPEARAARKVLQALRKHGLRLRSPADDAAGPEVASAEAALFMGGMRQLQAGHPARALDYFCAVLEINPDNQRAQMLAGVIQTAYIKALSRSTSDFPTLILFNPTRLLRLLDRTIGKLIFHRLAWLALLGLVGLAIYCYSITPYPDLHVGALDITVAVVLTLVHFFLHELAHGFACHHYGGAVNEIGVIFFYYIRPAPYCDTSSSYLFKDRRQQVGVQVAGAILSLVFCCALFVLLAVLHPSLPIYQAGQLILWVSVVLTFLDFIPFAKFDGYYALCDHLGIPNLRERSFQLLKAWVGRHLLGLATTEEPVSPGKRRLFFGFAVLSLAFTAAWIYQSVVRLLAPIVERFRGVGLVLSVVILAYLLRGTLFYPVGRLVRLAIRERRRIFTLRRTLALVAVAAALVAPWLIPTAVRVDADFVLVPRQRVEVRAQTGGFLDRVLVHEGDAVVAGQALAVLRNPDLDLALVVAEAELARVDAQLAELRRGARPEAMALARRQLAMAQATEAQHVRRADVAARLADSGLGIDAAPVVGAAAVSRSLASAAGWQLASLEAGARPEDIAAAEAQRTRLAAQLDHARAERALLTIRSPIDGVVATKHLEDRRYARLDRGDRFAEIHDVGAFVAEVPLSASSPLGELAAGDEIVLRPVGAPGEAIHCAVARLRDTVHAPGEIVAVTTPFATPVGRAGMVGHARLYGRRHSLAYAKLYLPLERVFRVELWSLL